MSTSWTLKDKIHIHAGAYNILYNLKLNLRNNFDGTPWVGHLHFSYSPTKGILYDAPSENNMSNAQEVRRSGGGGGGKEDEKAWNRQSHQ